MAVLHSLDTVRLRMVVRHGSESGSAEPEGTKASGMQRDAIQCFGLLRLVDRDLRRR